MKKKIVLITAALLLLLACPAYALEYSVAAPDTGLFGASTSFEPVMVVEAEDSGNIDRGKDSAYIPPVFGSAAAYLPGSGEPLTSHLTTPSTNAYAQPYAAPTAYTAVTSNLFYSGGYLGTLNVPAIGLSVRVYEGTDSAALAKGAGHFTGTSIWDGNVALAGHNRGVNNHFGKIHTLQVGDVIQLTTALGTRSYAVYSVQAVNEYDASGLAQSTTNVLTLYTCVMNQPDLRWCVKAAEI